MISTNEVEILEVPMARGDRITGNYNPVVIITTKDRQGRSNAAPIAMCMEVCQ
jgi:flavin reductase (DIM6/NTAB) family NADH-FMN oxidoreductase RutF